MQVASLLCWHRALPQPTCRLPNTHLLLDAPPPREPLPPPWHTTSLREHGLLEQVGTSSYQPAICEDVKRTYAAPVGGETACR